MSADYATLADEIKARRERCQADHAEGMKDARPEDYVRWSCEQCADEARYEAALREAARLREAAEQAVPTNWLDPLLTGPDAVLQGDGGWGCSDIERLLRAVRERVSAALRGER